MVINYNTLKLTEETINSVIEKTKQLKYEIILVDNASNDGSQNYFEKEYKYRSEIKFIKSEVNLGFGKANNLGIKNSKGKYVFLLNSDTILVNNAIKILFDYMEKNICVGICGANLYSQRLVPIHSFSQKLPSIKSEIESIFLIPTIKKRIFKKRADFNYSKFPKEVGYITGADMMIRKEILENSYFFDPDFFMYYEETELTNRVKKLGYKIISIPEAKIIHLEGQSFEFKEHRSRMMYESRYKYFNKVYGVKSLKWSYSILILNLVFKFLITFKNQYLKMIKINKEEYYKYKLTLKN
ncbi:glycosyltransferase family 2 protein [Psychrilyobacter sp. S5]|nr:MULTISPECIES: glycosyltransferase family 2 protein [Psychrilyobacter]MCS5420416.1 glycosyltransferase family 2 protein [Psychrilyobacter sp. S5]